MSECKECVDAILQVIKSHSKEGEYLVVRKDNKTDELLYPGTDFDKLLGATQGAVCPIGGQTEGGEAKD